MSEFDQYSGNYRELLDRSVRISGETGEYFAAYKARYVAAHVAPRPDCRLLDYGCGTGLVASQLRKVLPAAKVDGYDVSRESLAQVAPELRAQGAFVTSTSELTPGYDVVMMANVLHHILPAERHEHIGAVKGMLTAAGRLIIFEHNPLNPLTRQAVASCPVDENAILLPAYETMDYLRRSCFEDISLSYIVFFPHVLRWLRPLEGALEWCPLGAQYAVCGIRGSSKA